MRPSLAGILLTLLLARGAAAQEALPSGPEIHRNLERILSSGDYETSRPDADPAATFWSRVLRKIGELLRGLTFLGDSSPTLFWMILGVCLLILAAIFAHGGVILARSLRAGRAREFRPDAQSGRAEEWGAILERAAEEAREGRFTEAIRLCHRGALLGLDRRGLVRFHESYTSGDYRRQLQERVRERQLFDGLARVFEPAFFGRIPAGQPEYTESNRLARALAQEGSA